MAVLDRYMLNESVKMLFIGLLLFSGIFFGATEFRSLILLIVDSGVRPHTVLLIFLLYSPFLVYYALPAGMLMASVSVLHRQNLDSEVVGLRTNGIGPLRRLRPLFMLSLISALLSFLLAEHVLPYSTRSANKLAVLAMRDCQMPAVLRPIEFGLERSLVVGTRLDGEVRDVFVFDLTEVGVSTVTWAHSALWVRGKLDLRNGTTYYLWKNADKARTMRFSSMLVGMMSEQLKFKEEAGVLPVRMSSTEIRHEMDRLKNSAQPVPVDLLLKYYDSYSIPLTNILVLIAALPFVFVVRRSKTNWGFAYSGALILSFFILRQVGNSLSTNDRLDPLVGGWGPTIIALVIGLAFIQIAKFRRL